eukprot:scaffold261733_cov30-Tisochrysis_lutea.AAC.2
MHAPRMRTMHAPYRHDRLNRRPRVDITHGPTILAPQASIYESAFERAPHMEKSRRSQPHLTSQRSTRSQVGIACAIWRIFANQRIRRVSNTSVKYSVSSVQ